MITVILVILELIVLQAIGWIILKTIVNKYPGLLPGPMEKMIRGDQDE